MVVLEDLSHSRILDVLEDFDPMIALHSKRVSLLSQYLGKCLGLPEDDLRELSLAGLLHDIGMIAVPKTMINKKSPLSASELETLRMHPNFGIVIAEAGDFGEKVINAIHRHHERLDGSGYPNGLVGAEIDDFSRIVAVADAYEVMTSDRPCRLALSPQAALDELRTAEKYDQEVVAALVAGLSESREGISIIL